MGKVSESIFSGERTVIPMADVQHIEKHLYASDIMSSEIKKGDLKGISIITKHTKWGAEHDHWENEIWLNKDEAKKFISAWCFYRHELESETIKDLP